MKTLQLPQFSAVALWAGVIGIVVMAAPAAKAFTFNDAASDKSGDTSMFNDPVDRTKSGADSGDKTTDKRPKSGFYFSGSQSQSFDDRNGSERYFNPNRLLGR
jgi:hypothetical protein